MKKLHEKSPCCRGIIVRFGERRRRCNVCLKTWRVWKKKRGRKRARTSPDFLIKYLKHEVPSLYALARKSNPKSEDGLNRKLNRSLEYFVANTSWPEIPKEALLIAVADAMIIGLNGQQFTFYLILLRTTNGNRAVITKPFIKEGDETWHGWEEAFKQLPEDTLASICALVCDGHKGLVDRAKNLGWLIQRCHFHLLASVQNRRSRWQHSRHRTLGKFLYHHANEILTNSSDEVVAESVSVLSEIEKYTSSPVLRRILRGLKINYSHYRTYLKHPELNLPKTSNSAESVIGSIRMLCHRAHGFRTIKSLTLWAHALLKFKQTVACNGYLSTKLSR